MTKEHHNREAQRDFGFAKATNCYRESVLSCRFKTDIEAGILGFRRQRLGFNRCLKSCDGPFLISLADARNVNQR